MKAQTARGTRDFSPIEVKKRNYIIETIKRYFELYGYQPIETPAIENLSTLTGKYGEEGDQLLFKILNSRLHESKNKDLLLSEFSKMLEKPYNSEHITERALRYDLTVPFARYVAQYRHTITFPFKRYQIQPVWRADKPQKGRYREFVQCDADVIGTSSLLMEVELIQLINDVFSSLKIPVTLKINNRKIIAGIIESIGASEYFNELVVLIDKLDKADVDTVKSEMLKLGLNENQINKLFDYILLKNDNFEKLESLKSIDNTTLQKGIDEIYYILNFYRQNLLNIKLDFDVTLARGLNYYTGCIFEAKANVGNLSSSILGGGRYDDLTGIFDFPGVSGVGISFGIDRIYDVMSEANLFPEHLNNFPPAKVLLVFMDEAQITYAFQIAQLLRKDYISAEVYHQKDKLKKCFEYASKKGFQYVGIIGEQEQQNKSIALKDITCGQQENLDLSQLIEKLK
ncbi:MAG TPA: histidine--tRNA ligase [Bacteroidia bacterium]|nr:histidine--tRNA ligase [Bacteroidia bacterium]